MANSVSRPTNSDGRVDDVRSQRRRLRVISLSGSYPSGGEPLTPSQFGLKRFIAINPLGTAAETDLTGAWIVRVDIASNGRSANLILFEAGTAGGVQTQKPAEAYESAADVLVEAIGY